MCAQSDGKLGTHRLCLHYIGTLFVTPQKKLSGVLWTATTQGGASRSHASNIAPARLAERVWCAQFQSLLLNICFLSEGFRPRSYILNYFLNGPSGCSHFTSVWLKTYLIFDAPLSRSARRGAAFLRHRNRAATTALVCEQRPYRIWFSWRRQSYPVKCEHSLKAPLGYNQRRSYQRYEMIEYGFYISSFIFVFPFCLIFLHFL